MMRPVVIIKGKPPPNVFETGKKLLVKQLPPSVKPKPRPKRPPEIADAVSEISERLPKGLVAEQENGSSSPSTLGPRKGYQSSSDEEEIFLHLDESSNEAEWDPRKTAEIISRHRGVTAYVNTLRAEINSLEEKLAHNGTNESADSKKSQRLLYYQQQNRYLSRRLKRQIRQTIRLQMRLDRLGLTERDIRGEGDTRLAYHDLLLNEDSHSACRCTKALCVLVEALEESIPSAETTVLEHRLDVITRQRDSMFNELLALRDRVAEIQLWVESDPFLLAKFSAANIGLDISCALTKEEQRVILLRKIQGLDLLNRELQNQLAIEKCISRQWRPELRRILDTIHRVFADLVNDGQVSCWLSDKMSSIAKQLIVFKASDDTPENLKLRIRQDAKRKLKLVTNSLGIQYYVRRIGELERQIVFMADPTKDLSITEGPLAETPGGVWHEAFAAKIAESDNASPDRPRINPSPPPSPDRPPINPSPPPSPPSSSSADSTPSQSPRASLAPELKSFIPSNTDEPVAKKSLSSEKLSSDIQHAKSVELPLHSDVSASLSNIQEIQIPPETTPTVTKSLSGSLMRSKSQVSTAHGFQTADFYQALAMKVALSRHNSKKS